MEIVVHLVALERIGHLGRALETFGGIGLHGLGDERLHAQGQLGPQLAQRCVALRLRRGPVAREQRVHRGTEAVDVGAAVDVCTSALLWRRIAPGPQVAPVALRLVRGVLLTRDAEVYEAHRTVRTQHHV